MTIYYTAKDIEELAARGVQQLEVGPGITLTDFARETAQQLNIDLVDGGKPVKPPAPAPPSSRAAISGDKYNKPSGCMHASNTLPAANSPVAIQPAQHIDNVDSNTVNRLIDLMGKVMKRGG